jgi:hypothetical protein
LNDGFRGEQTFWTCTDDLSDPCRKRANARSFGNSFINTDGRRREQTGDAIMLIR